MVLAADFLHAFRQGQVCHNQLPVFLFYQIFDLQIKGSTKIDE